MAVYVGIGNENEFYSHHYLSEIFSGDIKEVLQKWQADEESNGNRAPWKQLAALSRDYFAVRDRFSRERNSVQRIAIQRDFFRDLLAALGYFPALGEWILEDGYSLPVLAKGGSDPQRPQLLAFGVYDREGEGADPLTLKPHRDQFHSEAPPAPELLREDWNSLITKRVFGQNHPPRWVLLLSHSRLLLIDRLKWNQNRLLSFDWDEILGRREDATLKAVSVLLHRDSLLPEEGQSLLDGLDENAHKHAYAVSEDLKYALREAIELLGNEAAQQLIALAREQKKGIFTGASQLEADQLTRECLRWMYRLLFLFYIEARPELDYVPIRKSSVYQKGYSLESLRDLEMVRLESEESRRGTFLHQSLTQLFRLVYEGYRGVDEQAQTRGGAIHDSFHIEPLDSHLFDPRQTPLLDRVRFRNDTLQKVIRLMSLSREGNGRRRGRVSYAQLGINQLGAVYEALLSYRGFFAREDLYEVKKAGTELNELETGYFVTASELEQYTEEERVFDRDEQGHRVLRRFSKGSFIYRLAGRDREKSASYYTPEVLTKCLVKYALKELLPGKSADEILQITICEPAMGSAAFLNEAVSQLAEAYLERKQGEIGRRIAHGEYAQELQRVKMYIADRNTFGIDLNPVAVELAEVSLWLNAIHGGRQVPWFGYQLFSGNSLIGARRQVYHRDLLRRRPSGEAWYDYPPVRLDPLNPKRQPDRIYHFLLPDPGMAAYTDRTAKELAPEAFRKLRDWRREFCKPFDAGDIETLLFLSEKADELWEAHQRQLRRDREKTEDELTIWPVSADQAGHCTTTVEKDRVHAEGIFNLDSPVASPYRRLKMAMDYWCALWFWPIERVDDLPDRDAFLMEIGLLLSGDIRETSPVQAEMDFSTPAKEGAAAFGGQINLPMDGAQIQLGLGDVQTEKPRVTNRQGQLRIESLFKHFPRLLLVHELAEHHHFFHWELTFADIFARRGGFDLILGNPPWIKVEWQEAGVLGDFNPLFVLRNFSAAKLAKEREAAFGKWPALRQAWFAELEQAEGTQSFLNAVQNYPLLKGMQTNLYKCFLPQAWMVGRRDGVSGFLHPEGIYDDPKGGIFRAAVYQWLRAHFQFHNELSLFAEVDHHMKFSINIFCTNLDKRIFAHIANLYAPATIDVCFNHKEKLGDVVDKWYKLFYLMSHIEVTLTRESIDAERAKAGCARDITPRNDPRH